MTDKFTEKRQFKRKRIKLACHLQVNNGLILTGYTQNMSNEGVFLETQAFPQDPRFRTLKIGDIGVLTLQYKIGGQPESLKTPCRIAHIIANGIGTHINTARLSTKDRKIIERILELETSDL